ncbi:MAG: FHA domain-containing protein [Planctomycetota bacterium]|nr:FHA domain-containing protein [Planctomycetota bacterium]
MIRIEILSGQDAGRLVELGPGTYTLGRREGVDVFVQGDAVSGKHLELTVSESGTVHFRDLGSTNGTWSGGIKAEDGEWFLGTELKLGNLGIRLLADGEAPGGASTSEATEPSDSSSQSDAAIHNRAVREVLEGGGRGGSWMMWLLLAIVVLAGGAYWFFNQTEEIDLATSEGPRRAAVVQLDAIEDLGHFEGDVADSWKLGKGLEIVGDELRSPGGFRTAELLPRFESAPCRIRVEGQLKGDLQAWPVLTCGTEDSSIIWAGDSLSKGGVELELPCEDFEWFQLQLQLKGSGSLSSLRVTTEGGEGLSFEKVGSGRKVLQYGANVVLQGLSGRIFEAYGSGGKWKSDPKGILFETAGQSWLRVTGSNVLILTEQEPIPAITGMDIAEATGLLFRGERPFWISFESPMGLSVSSAGILLQPTQPFLLDWDITYPLGEASRLLSDIERSSRQGDTATLLRATQELLHHWPFDEEKVALAETKRAEAIDWGRHQLASLETAAAEAVFLASADEMHRVHEEAAKLAKALPGTQVEAEAQAMIQVLDYEISKVLQEEETDRVLYNERLLGGLKRSYPYLATWLEEGGE